MKRRFFRTRRLSQAALHALCLGAVLFAGGCDSVYRYVVYPPQHQDFTLVPDDQILAQRGDSLYRLSPDGLTEVYDRKDFKVEVKYMTDYQLNNVEFPEESRSGQFSTNPFTYGNWVDPELGYTPHRFSVFKVTVYNYAASKVNIDPENSYVTTERGDLFPAYGREEKSSRNQSLEAYFKKRKGMSGVDDDVFESRMGIVRRTVLTLSKPVFRGDIRDGILVFDPVGSEVEHVKLQVRDFILGYDENNQPSEFTTLSFYFKRIPFEAPSAQQGFVAGRGDTASVGRVTLRQLDPKSRPSGEVRMAVRTGNVTAIKELMKPLDDFFAEETNFRTSYIKTTLTTTDLNSVNFILICADESQMKFTAEQEKATAEFIRRGGSVIADERSMSLQSENWQALNTFMGNIATLLGSSARLGRVGIDHPVYHLWKRIDALPPVDPELIGNGTKEVNDYMSGLFYEERLAFIISNRGYSTAWGAFGPPETRANRDYSRHREFLSNIIYYDLESTKSSVKK